MTKDDLESIAQTMHETTGVSKFDARQGVDLAVNDFKQWLQSRAARIEILGLSTGSGAAYTYMLMHLMASNGRDRLDVAKMALKLAGMCDTNPPYSRGAD